MAMAGLHVAKTLRVALALAALWAAPCAAQEAVSADGTVRAVARDDPPALLLLDAADGTLMKAIAAEGRRGRASPISAVAASSAHEAFVVALRDVAELWLVYWADPPPFTGFVHNWRSGQVEGVRPERFPVRRIDLSEPLADMTVGPRGYEVLGQQRHGEGALVVINLDVRQEIKRLALPGQPALGKAVHERLEGRGLLAVPDAARPSVFLIDPGTWTVLGERPAN